MALCTITGRADGPSGASIEGDVLIFRPSRMAGYADSTGRAVIPKTVRTVVQAGSNISISLYSGPYTVQSVSELGVDEWGIIVPIASSATLAECLSAVASDVYSQTQLAVLAASGLPTYASTGIGIGATVSGNFFMVPAVPSGLNIWQNVGGVATLRGSLLNFNNVPQTDILDITENRLMLVGAFGLGNNGPAPLIANIDDSTIATGFYRVAATTTGTFPGSAVAGTLVVESATATQCKQTFISSAAPDRAVYVRRFFSGAWGPWDRQYSSYNLIGTVSQAAGVPTGAVVERGSNANGEYVRFADGTQICTRVNLSAANASTALGSIFRSSANVTWTFPAAFAVAPAISGDVDDADSWLVTAAAPTTTSSSLRVLAGATKASALNFRAIAIGRWF